MRRKLVVLLITIAIMLTSYAMVVLYLSHTDNGSPIAKHGEVDLSHWSFTQNGAVKLNGAWDFYPNQLLAPNVFTTNQSPPLHTTISVPGSWSDKMRSFGVGTYQLRVKISNDHTMYGIRMQSIQMASRLFVNGVAVGSSGNPAKGSLYVGKNAPYVAFFTMHSGYNTIVVQCANFNLPSGGGMSQSIYLGSANQIVALERKALANDYIAVSLFIFMGLYCLGMYFQQRRNYLVLLLSTLCVFLALFSACSGEKLIYDVNPSIPAWLILRVQVASSTAVTLFLLLYVYFAFQKYCIRPLVWTGLVSGFVLIFSQTVLYHFMYSIGLGQWISSAYIIFILGYLISVLVSGTLAKAEGGIYLFIAAIALSLYALINNLSLFYHVPLYTFPPIDSLTLILMLSLSMSLKFPITLKQNALLSEQLLHANKMKDEFLSKTAHEFKTPLHGMISIAQSMMDDSALLTKEQRENLGLISALAKRLSQLVYDILDFMRLQQGEVKVTPGSLDVRSAVDVILRIYSFMISEKPVRLVNNVPEKLPFALADEGRFRQICINLLDNALKHTKEGTIEITAIANEDMIEVSVIDSGRGIEEDYLSIIFQAFTSIEDGSDQSFGLGLSIVKQLVELQNGRVWVRSTKGEGSTFTFSLPILHSREKLHVGERKPIEVVSHIVPEYSFPIPYISQKKGAYTILVVDDRFSNLKILIDSLEKLDYTVVAVNSGNEALKYLEKYGGIDLVILDLMMPGLSGLEVCQTIRMKHTLLELPVVMVTASIQNEDKVAAFAVGANDYLPKPFDAAELRARAKSLLVMRESAKKAIEMEVAFLQSQIKPHFLFNVLNTIMALSYLDMEKSRKLILDLSDYLRGSFSFSNVQTKVPLHREFALIRSYVEIEKARFKDRVCVDYEVDPSTSDVMIPPLLIQPLVENAIRHGIANRIEGGRVSIRGYRTDGYIVFEIEDTGLGMTDERLKEVLTNALYEETKEYRSVGLQNINKRLRYLYGTELSIQSSFGIGTKVTIRIT